MNTQIARQQLGSVWIILLVLIAIVAGAWQYSEHQADKKRIAAEVLAQAEQRRRDAERAELEKRLAEERQKQDALMAASKALDSLLSRWDDAVKIAGTTGRIAMSGPVSTLQSIRREAEALTVSPCMDTAKALLLASMQHSIDGFLTFMRNELSMGAALAKFDFDEAAKKFAEFKAAREGCSR